MLVALFARTYKEAQTQLSLLMFLPMIPGFLFAFGSIPERRWMEWTPVVGQQLMLSGMLRGEPAEPAAIAAIALITIALGVAVAAAAARLLSHESIVRRLN
jgi:sodium transport system permease protein